MYQNIKAEIVSFIREPRTLGQVARNIPLLEFIYIITTMGSPSTDGFNAEFYQTFQEWFRKTLLKLSQPIIDLTSGLFYEMGPIPDMIAYQESETS